MSKKIFGFCKEQCIQRDVQCVTPTALLKKMCSLLSPFTTQFSPTANHINCYHVITISVTVYDLPTGY